MHTDFLLSCFLKYNVNQGILRERESRCADLRTRVHPGPDPVCWFTVLCTREQQITLATNRPVKPHPSLSGIAQILSM